MTASLQRLLVVPVWLGLAAPVLAGQECVAILVDRHLTVGAGASVTTTLGAAVARGEDVVVPVRVFSERGPARRAANISYRVARLLLFDLPQEEWLVVLNHEVMGHGARLRERFGGPINYSLPAPPPYGRGGGVTSFRFDRQPTGAELLMISAAGMEADAVAARVVAARAFTTGRLRPRDAIRYLGFELDTFDYVRGTGDDLEREPPGHDVAQFLETYNAIAADAGASPLTARRLRREVLASLANPMIGVAAFGLARYLWNGSSDVSVPAFSVGGVRWLPLARYQLTPYGTETAVTTHLAGARWATRVEVRVGRAPTMRPWGLGVERRAIAAWSSWRLDAGLDIWRQPRIAARTEAANRGSAFGIDVRGRLERDLLPVWFSETRASIVVDVGVKTGGFVPGQPIGGGLTVRAGFGLPFN